MASPRLLAAAAASFLFPTALALLGVACEGNVRIPGQDGDGGDGGGGYYPSGPGPGAGPDGGKDALSEYTEEPCKDKPPPLEAFECNPYDQPNGTCPAGEACYIFVDYPSEPCGQEIYGAFCYPAGPGQQGDPCNGGQDCGVGHVCVVTGSGTQCVVLCELSGFGNCPAGLVCEPIDVEGFGGCL